MSSWLWTYSEQYGIPSGGLQDLVFVLYQQVSTFCKPAMQLGAFGTCHFSVLDAGVIVLKLEYNIYIGDLILQAASMEPS
jgi:hypothetical protein